MGTTPISTLAPFVANRMEEVPGATVFWSTQFEIYTALVEAISDLLLLVGRPTQVVNQVVTLLPNTPWQPMPAGLFCISDIQGPGSTAWKYTLWDFDFTQTSWNSAWENDMGDAIQQWFPIGFTMFGIHPSLSAATQVLVTGIAPATTNPWPYTGAETVPFHSEMFVALELYAASYMRVKEGGNEWNEGVTLYRQYLDLAQRLTMIEDRRDPYIFSQSVGGQVSVNPVDRR